MAGSNKRIAKGQELADITTNPPEGTKVKLADESNIFIWEVLLDGPEESVYAGGHFKLKLVLPTNYPFKPPVLSFETRIYHPNVTNDDKGSMCLGILRSDEWKPPNQIRAVLKMVRDILVTPDIDNAVEGAIAELYKSNRKWYDKQAKEWVAKYAGKK
ncbi:hypothetical protein LTR66_014515 [Elasticomyces elasticus]|nr:hypothetical protein LTR66_014515 [Elasticomyces elasticus]